MQPQQQTTKNNERRARLPRVPVFVAHAFALSTLPVSRLGSAWSWVSQPGRVLLVVAGLGVVLGLRVLLVRRELARRKTLELRPFDEFDPSSQDVATFALRLDRLRRRLPARFLKPSQAVTVTLGGSAGVLTYTLTIPCSGERVLRSALYDRVELLAPDTALPASMSVLAGPSTNLVADASESYDERLGDLARNDAEDEPGWRGEETL